MAAPKSPVARYRPQRRKSDAYTQNPSRRSIQPRRHDRGPVLILVEYHVEGHNRTAFLHAIDRLLHERRRDGAYGWGATEENADPQKVVE